MSQLMIVSMLIFFGLSVPVAVSIGLASLAGVGAANLPWLVVAQQLFAALDKYPLVAIPFFILAGNLMEAGGISERMVEFAKSVVGGIQGGLACTCVLTCMIFAAVAGSSVATTFAVGAILIPAMIRHGYPAPFAASLQASAAELGVIIPPSIPMIIYGIAAQQSVPQLFLAGFAPGILIGVVLAAYVMYYAKKKNIPITPRPSWATIRQSSKGAIWAALAPLVIFGGIYGGLFTPTEAAGIACIYAIFVSMFIYREMTWPDLWRITLDSATLSAQVLIIVSAAGAFAWLITTSGFPARLVAEVSSWGLSTWMLLLAINVILLFVGSVLEPPAAILLLTPLLTPIAYSAGVHPIHFGIIVTVNLAIGLFMPPFGLNLFAAHALFRTPLPDLYRGVLPFLAIYLVMLALITYVPAITLAPLALFH